MAQLTSVKFWQMRHFVWGDGASFTGFVLSQGGKSCMGGCPFAMHSSFSLWSISDIDIPLPVWAFWVSMVGEQALTSSGAM